MLVPVPIGAFVMVFAFDVASKVVEGRPFGRAAAWLALLGVISAVVAAVPGLLDLRRLTQGTVARRVATLHLALMVAVTALYLVSFLLRRADDAQYGHGTPVAAMIISTVALAVLALGIWQGTTLVYSYGVRVVDEDDQLIGHLPPRDVRAD